MGFGALRSIVSRSISRTLVVSRVSSTPSKATLFLSPSVSQKPNFPSTLVGSFGFGFGFGGPVHILLKHFSIFTESKGFDRLTDTRFPKRRPLDKPRRKRAGLRPPGPYAWVDYVPGQPIQPNSPNQGSVKRRNEKNRRRLHRAFVMAEAKKRKTQLQEAKRKKNIKKVERKMAAVARERAWAERLAELQQLEEEKEKSTA